MANQQIETGNDLQRFKADTAYFEAHRGELLHHYPEQWVAIFDRRVVASDANFDKLLDAVQAAGVPLGSVFVQHVTSKEETLILVLTQ